MNFQYKSINKIIYVINTIVTIIYILILFIALFCHEKTSLKKLSWPRYSLKKTMMFYEKIVL